MLLDKNRRGIQYNYLDNLDKLYRGKEEPQWQQHSKAPPQWQKVLHNNTKMAYTVRLNATTPVACGKATARIRPSFTSASCCAGD